MKKNNQPWTLVMLMALLGCASGTAEKETANTNKTASINKTVTPENAEAVTKGDGLIGDWKLMLETYDDNENKKLDPEERSKAFSNNYFYSFKKDGSCLVNFTRSGTSGFKAHYVIEPEKGRQKLSVYLDEGENTKNPEAIYYIISVNKDELVLLEAFGELTFWIFSRV